MCGGGNKGMGKILDPFNVMQAFETPKRPDIKKPKTISEAEKKRRADLAMRVRRERAKGATGFSDTRRTGTLGTGNAGNPKNPKSLIGY